MLGTGLVTTTFTVPASFTTTFIGPNGGEWNTAANWSTGEVPGITDDVVINNTVNFDGATGVNAVGIHSLTVNAGSTLNLNSGTLGVNGLTNAPGTIVNNGASVSFGGAATIGTLTQNAGTTLVNQSSQLGAVTLTGGTLEIDGGSTVVGIAQPSTIATLTQSGGTLQGASTVTVTGATILTGGLMFGNGTTVTQGGLTINAASVDGTGTFHLQRVLENKGVATWSSGNIDLGGERDQPAHRSPGQRQHRYVHDRVHRRHHLGVERFEGRQPVDKADRQPGHHRPERRPPYRDRGRYQQLGYPADQRHPRSERSDNPEQCRRSPAARCR